MGNAHGGRGHKGEDFNPPHSPNKDDHNQIFIFDKKQEGNLLYQSSVEEDDPSFASKDSDTTADRRSLIAQRQRANTVSEGTVLEDQVFPTVFKWNGGGEQVMISGTFTDWKTIPMVKSHGDFVTIIDLPEGDHQFKFFVDGEWRHDPSHKIVDNEVGTKNNIISIKNTDFEVFQALAMDSEAGSHAQPGEWGQIIPTSKPWEKPHGPPILPPHLLQVILNKDVPISCEPTLLPEPNHVMLNHLYALSITDGVMVLSATHRYRRKYVTTLLYKPI